jgi:hypothetical protein
MSRFVSFKATTRAAAMASASVEIRFRSQATSPATSNPPARSDDASGFTLDTATSTVGEARMSIVTTIR